MAQTPSQIREEAAKKLGIMGEGQTLRPEYSADLDQAYLEVHSELEQDGITSWDETADIPNQYVWPLVTLVAFARATKYKVPPARFQELALEEQKAMRKIYKLSQVAKMSDTEIVNF